MRLVAIAVLLVLTGCQVSARSDDFRCERAADCVDGRTCEAGWCVATTTIDAADDGATEADAEVCPPECSECAAGRCVMLCGEEGSCSAEVVCPEGIPCTVECSGIDACGGGVDCSAASDCDIECTGVGSCGGATTCGTGPCLIRCTASGTCAGDLTCNTSCRCDAECTGADACGGAISCGGPGTCNTGNGCTSGPNPCDSCP